MAENGIRRTEGRGRLFDSVLDTIGDTPVIRVNNIAPAGVRLYVKAEAFNPAASVKDRQHMQSILDQTMQMAKEQDGSTTPTDIDHMLAQALT